MKPSSAVKRMLLLYLAFAMVIACLPHAAPRALAVSGVSANVNNNEWEVLKLVNKERIRNGITPVSLFSALQDAAHIRAHEVKNLFSHTRPNGSQWFTVIGEESLSHETAGENIAAGYPSPSDVMIGWMNSTGHRENILNEDHHHMAVSFIPEGEYGNTWVQLFFTSNSCATDNISLVLPNDSITVVRGTAIEALDIVISMNCKGTSGAYMPLITELTTGYDSNETGRQTVTVTVEGKTASFDINVTDDYQLRDIRNHWAKEYIQWCYDEQLFGGVSTTEFGPDMQMNRGMAVTVMYRLEGQPRVSGRNQFSDVSSNQYYYDAVAWATANNIVAGIGGGLFAPEQPVTREQLVTILLRYAADNNEHNEHTDGGNYLSNYPDEGSISPWAWQAVNWAVANELIKGRDSGRLDPQGYISRAEVSTIIYRYQHA